MSHQSGISGNAELLKSFAEAREGNVRAVKVSIANEQLVPSGQLGVVGSWQDDFDSVQTILEENVPCYVFYRLDSSNNLGYEWQFIAYSPDGGPLKLKMLYASTKATVRREFGEGYLKGVEMFCTSMDEVTLVGYQHWTRRNEAPPPLTRHEEELSQVKRDEHLLQLAGGVQTMQGLAFPVLDDAYQALSQVANSAQINYVELEIDTKAEQIRLRKACNADINQLASVADVSQPGYHVYRYDHQHNGQQLNSLVFVYFMPENTQNISTKVKMLYSSCKSTFLAFCEQRCSLVFAKRLEISDADDLSAGYFNDQLHPVASSQKLKFAKPKRPGRP